MDALKVVTWRVPHVAAAYVEAATLPETDRVARLRALREAIGARDLAYVPTCQRVILATLDAPADLHERARDAYRALAGVHLPEGETFTGAEAFRHLAEVASSLDSLVVGEPQVLGQFKASLQQNVEAGLAGPALRHVLSLVLRAAKAVRAETDLFRGKVSLVPLTEGLVHAHLEGRPRPRAVVLGTGTIGEKMAEMLATRPDVDLHVVSRSPSRAAEVAQRHGARGLSLVDFLDTPPEGIDLVACAMATETPLLDAKRLQALAQDRDVLVLDLAIPRNTERPVETAPRLRLVQMDDLVRIREEGQAQRLAEVDAARAVLEREVARVQGEYEARKMAQDLARLAERFDEVARERLAMVDAAEPAFRKWYEQTVRALLHEAAQAVKEAGCRKDGH